MIELAGAGVVLELFCKCGRRVVVLGENEDFERVVGRIRGLEEVRCSARGDVELLLLARWHVSALALDLLYPLFEKSCSLQGIA